MLAYLVLLAALLSRLLPPLLHLTAMNFTAVGGSLLFFGARRPRWQSAVAVGALMVTDYLLTVYAYHYAFHVRGYLVTCVGMVRGRLLTWRCVVAPRDGRLCGRGRPRLGDIVLCVEQLCGLDGAYVPAHDVGAWRLLCSGAAVLPERPGFDWDCRRRAVWAAGAGCKAHAQWGSAADGGLRSTFPLIAVGLR